MIQHPTLESVTCNILEHHAEKIEKSIIDEIVRKDGTLPTAEYKELIYHKICLIIALRKIIGSLKSSIVNKGIEKV
jgi:hypothetical protein